jgi:GNAT superfamily N-acetyltransferase
MSDTEPREADSDHIESMAQVLADAFHEDPIFVWLFPDPATRPARAEGMFGMLGRHIYVPVGECQRTDVAAAYWEPPGAPSNDDFWVDHGDEFATVIGDAIERIGALGVAMAEHHPPEPCWYLALLGVRSSAQGRGIGGALLEAKLARIDSAGEPAYLEASTPRNRALYERHGFEVVEEFAAEGGAPPMWAMWRPGR